MKAVNHHRFVKYLFMAGFQDFLSPLQSIPLDLNQLVDIPDFFYIILGKTSVTLFVFFGSDDIKFPFPISYQ